MKEIMVTGVNGFVGKHLARELYSRNLDVVGIGNENPVADESISHLLSAYFQFDINDPDGVSKLDLTQVDCVINLAGLAAVGPSFDNPELYMCVNVGVLSVLGKELLRQNPSARIIAVSSGALYDPSQEMPLNESSKIIESGSPYAHSKLAMENYAKELCTRELDCVVVRPFNHIGPGQGLGFLIPDLVDKLKKTDKNNLKITVGNIKTVRDYTDVRDIAKAYANLATAKDLNHNLYNVCSGTGLSGEDIIKSLCIALNINFEKLQLEVDSSLIRPTDPLKIVGNSSLLQSDTGWKPEISIDKTVKDIVDNLN